MGLVGSGITNECGVITIFPLGVECVPTNPSTTTSFDGNINLIITGGTAPYRIVWSNGNTIQNLYGLGAGEYTATVVDYYGDFTAITTCNLIQPTTTTTTFLPTITVPIQMALRFCMSKCKNSDCENFTFNAGNIINGIKSWTSSTMTVYYDTVNGRWTLDGYIAPSPNESGLIISNDPPTANPPFNWDVLGSGYRPNITIEYGDCNLIPRPFNKSITNPTCSSSNDGTIIITPNVNGIYHYSKNGGLTYQSSPVFSNLSSGQYNIVLKEVDTNIISSDLVTLTNQNPFRSFVLTFTSIVPTVNYTAPNSIYDTTQISNRRKEINSFELSIQPPLNFGETISFNISFIDKIQFRSPGNYNVSNNVLLYKNNIQLSGTVNTETNLTSLTNDCLWEAIESTNSIISFNSIVLTNSDTLTGSISSISSLTGMTNLSGCSTYLTNEILLVIDNLIITPQKCRNIISSNLSIQLDNNLEYIEPPIILSFNNRWITQEESALSGFTYNGDINEPTSPGITPEIAFNFNSGCFLQNTTCFPLSNTIIGGPVLISNINQVTTVGGVRGGVINLLLRLGGTISGNSCAKIFGTLKVSINSQTPIILTTLDGLLGVCSTVFTYNIPMNANIIEFTWEQTKL